MSEFRRRLMMQVESDPNALPAGCVRCEYLESYTDSNNSNSQYIDTEKRLWKEEIFGYKVSFLIPPTTGKEKGVCGWQDESSAYACYIRVFPNYFDISFGSIYQDKYAFKSADDIFDIEFNPVNKTVLINKSISPYKYLINDLYRDYGYAKLPMYLFTANNNGSPWSGANMRVYDYWVKDKDGNYVQHLLPILDPNGKPCMYDVVAKKFYFNKRTNRAEDFRYKILEQ